MCRRMLDLCEMYPGEREAPLDDLAAAGVETDATGADLALTGTET